MKRLFFVAVFLLATTLCVYAQPKQTHYKAAYSSSFKMGDQALANKILELWKDWDDNMLDRHDYFADTVVMMFADGTTLKGKKENMEAAKKYRGGMKSVVSTIHAWVPMYSVDRKENTVLVWGTEANTMADGKVENRDIHEVWWFNKDGKITALRQWVATFKEPTAN